MEYLIGYAEDGRLEGFFIIDHPAAPRPSGSFVQVSEQEYSRVFGECCTHYIDGAFIVQKPEITTDQLAASVRVQRNSLLSASDWTQLPDVPESIKTTWASYRQALRDITVQPGFPSDITWPTAPV